MQKMEEAEIVVVANRPIQESDLRQFYESDRLISIRIDGCSEVCDLRLLDGKVRVQELHIQRCEKLLGFDALRHQKALYRLCIVGSDIGDCNMHAISSIETLQELNISNCKAIKSIDDIMRLSNLKVICLCETAITDADVRRFKDMRSLAVVELEKCKLLTDVSPLSFIESLEKLNLNECIMLATIGTLGALPQLKILYLKCTAITDEAVRSIGKIRKIAKLDISGCDYVTDISPLASVKSLEELDCGECAKLTTIGALRALPQLKALTLHCAAITNECVRSIGKSRTLVKLDISGCERVTNVSHLASILSLETLNLTSCTSLTTIGALIALPRLFVLSVSDTAITDECVHSISESHTLVELYIQNCQHVTDFHPVARIQTLQKLRLDKYTGSVSIAALQAQINGRTLHLNKTDITNDSIRVIGKSLTLVELRIEKCEKITDVSPLTYVQSLERFYIADCTGLKIIGDIGKLPKLTVLVLSNTAITDECVRSIGESRSLFELNIKSCKHVTDVSPLAAVSTLKKLTLHDCTRLATIGGRGTLPKLTELSLDETAIADECVRSVGNSRSLVKLQLWGCKNLNDVSPLAAVSTLEELILDGCGR